MFSRGLQAAAAAEAEVEALRADPDVEFSGEEGLGRYLDLVEMHQVTDAPCEDSLI